MGRNSYFYILILVLISCSTHDDLGSIIPINKTLESYIGTNQIMQDNVIACASASETNNEVIVYFYPRSGATDFSYYETENLNVDKNDYRNYVKVELLSVGVFNGYLRKFSLFSSEEKWVIISFMENGILHLSNPIRLKHRTQGTIFSDAVSIDYANTGMPLFSWVNSVLPEDSIYFQVVSNELGELLSGTYTVESRFQYYNTDNVVLNITLENPPSLSLGTSYNFTLMGVSVDNWVNTLIEKPFTVE